MLQRKVPVIEGTIYDDIETLIEGLGFRVVELKAQPIRSALMVSLVVHKPGGIGVDDCATVHRTVLPRLEAVLDRDDIRMEVSSPGIGRKLKSWSEFKAFRDEAMVLGLTDGSTVSGVVSYRDLGSIELKDTGGSRVIDTGSIAWARLSEE